MNVNMFICNTCFITFERIQKPFCLTQCGHIFCQRCIVQAEKQCPRCHQINVGFMELQESSLTGVENLFSPVAESLRSLANTCEFQTNQEKITLQRFHDIDKKYEMLKTCCCNMNQAIKALKDKYIKLKMDTAEKRKELMSIEMHNRVLNSSNHVSTPNNVINERSSGRNTKSFHLSSRGTNTSRQSYNIGTGEKKLGGFHIANPQSIQFTSPRPMNTRSTLHESSNARFSLRPSLAKGSNYTFRT
ncbi:RING finger protein 212B-like [Hylaeus volcanicus]|uniref:RING finger protein 212B-like n=1 Tax=Hylaeus volcanicus TaxID=313075 RepID=UPI0023B81B37|nr:RING finger protein 212B-like [Hylaeus volcanicus]